MYNFYIILTFFFIKVLLSNDILEKYVSISTYNDSIIFNSTNFSKGDIISFKFEINSSQDDYNNNICEEQLEYEYYDDINNIIYNNTRFSTKAILSESSNLTKFFNINKTESELNGLEGNYLLLYFNCDGLVTIENIRKNTKKLKEKSGKKQDSDDYTFSIIFTVFFILVIILCVVGCCDNLKKCGNDNFVSCVNCFCDCFSSSSNSNNNISQENSSQRDNSSQRGAGTYIYSRNRQIPPQSPSSINVINNQ